jgi:hypothetical protein
MFNVHTYAPELKGFCKAMQFKSYLYCTFSVVATDAHLHITKNIITVLITFTGSSYITHVHWFLFKKGENTANYSSPENENIGIIY